MNIQETVLENLKDLTIDKQKAVLEFVKFLKYKQENQPHEAEQQNKILGLQIPDLRQAIAGVLITATIALLGTIINSAVSIWIQLDQNYNEKQLERLTKKLTIIENTIDSHYKSDNSRDQLSLLNKLKFLQDIGVFDYIDKDIDFPTVQERVSQEIVKTEKDLIRSTNITNQKLEESLRNPPQTQEEIQELNENLIEETSKIYPDNPIQTKIQEKLDNNELTPNNYQDTITNIQKELNLR